MGYLEPKTIEKFKKTPKNWKFGFLIAPKLGISGVTQRSGVLKMVLKTAERNFVKTVKVSSQSEQALKVIKISF